MLPRGILLTLTLGCSLALAAALPPGRPLADIPMESLGNTTVTAREYLGKTVLIAVITTRCPECIATAEMMTRLQRELGPRGVQMIGAIAGSNQKNLVPPFIARYKINFPLGFVYPEAIQKLANLSPGIRPFVPILIFVDREGMVRQQYFGNDPFLAKGQVETTVRNTLEQLVTERPRPTKKK